jgi:3-deoxy-D-manno-octulosonic-acid transferase
MSESLLFSAYRLATELAAPLMPLWLQWRARQGKEWPARLRERFGETDAPRPEGALIWCHAASVGETTSVLPLVASLSAKGFAVVLTTGTVTSAKLAEGRLPHNVIHQVAPHDHTPWINRFLDHWGPGLALRVDSEIWPNTLYALHARRIPVVQINARMSAKAFDSWSIFPGFMTAVFGLIDLASAQSEEDRLHYEKLGVGKAVLSGNLKLAQEPLPYDAGNLATLKAQAGNRPAWTAASIHPGEDVIVGRAHQAVKATHPNALLYIVPRHPERGAEMARNLRTLGLNVAQRSAGESVQNTTDIYVADTMGELGLFYRLSPVALVGKSFAVGGGQNPAEPAQLGRALLWGPDMSNFTELAAALEATGAAWRVTVASALGPAVSKLLTDATLAADMGAKGQRHVAANAGALNRTLDLLAPYLNRLQIR